MSRKLIIASILWLALIICCYLWVDFPLMLAVHNHALATIKNIAGYFTYFGYGAYPIGVFAILTLIAYLLKPMRKYRHIFLLGLLALIISGIACDILKVFFGRARPVMWWANNSHIYGFHWFEFNFHATFWSFPSGHSTTAASFCAVLWLTVKRFRFIWILIAVGVFASRILLLAHYSSDTLAGGYLGWLTAYLLYRYWYLPRQLAS